MSKPARLALSVAALTAAATLTTTTSQAGAIIPLKNAAMITRTDHGYLYRAGQQDSHLVVSQVKGSLRFADSRTHELRSIPSSCHRIAKPVGIAAVCAVPSRVSASRPMAVEVWPRLGDDFIDASALPAAIRVSVLADAGHDIVFGGGGNDFINGAQDGDRVWGGAGNDWIRTGIGGDDIRGGPGNDKLVGVEGHDTVHGGAGRDEVGGGPGNDSLHGGGGADVVRCGTGLDTADADRTDRRSDCER